MAGVEVKKLVTLTEAEPKRTTLGEKSMEMAHLPAHPPTNLTLNPKTWRKILHPSKGLYKRWLSAQRNIFRNHQIRHPNHPVDGRLSRIPTSIWEQNGIRDPWTLQHTKCHTRIPFLKPPVPSKGTKTIDCRCPKKINC
jgi:hypothetical protein